MMRRLSLLMPLLMLFACDTANRLKEAPEFNERKNFAAEAYMREEYDTAAYVFRQLIDSVGLNASALVYNYAQASYFAGDTATARAQYERIAELGDSLLESKVYLQMGTLAGQKKDNEEQTLSYLKKALLLNPDNELARYNYEIVKMLAENKLPEGPSEFAKELKKKSDKLVAEHRFGEAFRLMMQGLKVDVTVQHYAQYIQRLNDITEIDEKEQ